MPCQTRGSQADHGCVETLVIPAARGCCCDGTSLYRASEVAMVLLFDAHSIPSDDKVRGKRVPESPPFSRSVGVLQGANLVECHGYSSNLRCKP